jgi:hypothetical protein
MLYLKSSYMQVELVTSYKQDFHQSQSNIVNYSALGKDGDHRAGYVVRDMNL